jgi:2-desacetyl-2-hydroxyethyl bacteriochlorophyllide A dehydrogenase
MLRNSRVAIVAPGRAEIQAVDVDESTLAPEEVWVRTRYSLISAGTEGAAFANATGSHRYPAYPGYASVGEVIREGTEFPDVHRGDLVFCYGSHQRYSRARLICLPLPAGLDPSFAPFARMATVAMTALRVSALEIGDRAAVIGQGSVGVMCAQLLQLAGVTAVGIDLAARRLRVASACGVRHTVDASSGEDAVVEAVMGLSAGQGVEATVEAVGNPRTIHLAARLTGKLGEIILLGSPRGTYETNVTDVLNYAHLWGNGCLTIKGAHEWRFPVRSGSLRPGDPVPKHSLERNTRIVFDLLRERRLAVEPLRTHVLPPAAVEEAYTGLRDKKDEYVGVVFDWTGD